MEAIKAAEATKKNRYRRQKERVQQQKKEELDQQKRERQLHQETVVLAEEEFKSKVMSQISQAVAREWYCLEYDILTGCYEAQKLEYYFCRTEVRLTTLRRRLTELGYKSKEEEWPTYGVISLWIYWGKENAEKVFDDRNWDPNLSGRWRLRQ